MAENFSEKYAHLKPNGNDVPVRRAGNYPNTPQLPGGYGKTWVNPPDGFANLFCKDYDKEEKDNIQDE